MDGITAGVSRMGVHSWKRQWWDDYEKMVHRRSMPIVTMTFCVRGAAPGIHARLKSIAEFDEKVRAPVSTGVKKRGRKPRERDAFPNLAGNNLTVFVEKACTVKVFCNGSVQVLGCPSFTAMTTLSAVIERAAGKSVTVDVNSISVMKCLRSAVGVADGSRISCSMLSAFLNANYPEWEESNFHHQSRQTNLNLWYGDEAGRRHYAAVYPCGSMRITSTNARAVESMFDSVLSACRRLHSLSELVTC